MGKFFLCDSEKTPVPFCKDGKVGLACGLFQEDQLGNGWADKGPEVLPLLGFTPQVVLRFEGLPLQAVAPSWTCQGNEEGC